MEAFEACGVDPAFYANRRRSFDEVLPWDHIDYGVKKELRHPKGVPNPGMPAGLCGHHNSELPRGVFRLRRSLL